MGFSRTLSLMSRLRIKNRRTYINNIICVICGLNKHAAKLWPCILLHHCPKIITFLQPHVTRVNAIFSANKTIFHAMWGTYLYLHRRRSFFYVIYVCNLWCFCNSKHHISTYLNTERICYFKYLYVLLNLLNVIIEKKLKQKTLTCERREKWDLALFL